ncbi:hypothetical protein BDR04DRAFT_1159785 [Suillus decipiens]|nr:hypothetical protein BDR04DRAFT_1159785 [Suillus decipiens]
MSSPGPPPSNNFPRIFVSKMIWCASPFHQEHRERLLCVFSRNGGYGSQRKPLLQKSDIQSIQHEHHPNSPSSSCLDTYIVGSGGGGVIEEAHDNPYNNFFQANLLFSSKGTVREVITSNVTVIFAAAVLVKHLKERKEIKMNNTCVLIIIISYILSREFSFEFDNPNLLSSIVDISTSAMSLAELYACQQELPRDLMRVILACRFPNHAQVKIKPWRKFPNLLGPILFQRTRFTRGSSTLPPNAPPILLSISALRISALQVHRLRLSSWEAWWPYLSTFPYECHHVNNLQMLRLF